MTSEILIMNKQGIAMAADSAVTINRIKTYNGVNKLFMLSNNPPMGIMVFGNPNFEGIPIETLIKEYKKNTNFESINTISKIKKDFLRYISSNTTKTDFKEKIEENKDEFHRFMVMESFYWKLEGYDEFVKNCEKIKIPSFFKKITETNEIDRHITELINIRGLEDPNQKLLHALKKFFIKRYLCNNTGIVIAGFNVEELFPSYSYFCLCANINNKIETTNDKSRSNCKTSYIKPFAQKEVITNFLTGIHEEIKPQLITSHKTDLDEFYQKITASINSNDNLNKKSLEIVNEILIKHKQDIDMINTDFEEKIDSMGKNNFNKYLNSINYLPKEELANMAESLIHITSLKHKVTENVESVGGAIDVAIISKGDGFIWKKRKHYFDADLNPQFFNR